MDLATLVGLVGAIAIICVAILLGGDFGYFRKCSILDCRYRRHIWGYLLQEFL